MLPEFAASLETFSDIILDLDDTLYPEESWRKSCYEYLADYFKEPDLAGFLSAFSYTEAISHFKLPVTLEQFRELGRCHPPTIALYSGVQSFLEINQKKNLFLVTNGYARTQSEKIKALGIATCFKAIVICDWFGPSGWKPSPVPYDHLETHFHIKSPLVIGDKSTDFEEPLRRNWTCVQILRAGVAALSDHRIVKRFGL